MSSDFNCNFGFVVEEIVELGILKYLDVSTLDTHRIYFFEKCKAILNKVLLLLCTNSRSSIASAYYTEKKPRLTGTVLQKN